MTASQQPRVRQWKPKSRSGCKPCKLRRVKCGEEQPVCSRCLRNGSDCEYNYVRKGNGNRLQISQTAGPLLRIMALTSDLDAAGRAYMNRFPQVVGANIFTNCIGPEFWHRGVMRELRAAQPIRQAVLALCALDLAFSIRPSDRNIGTTRVGSYLESPATWSEEARKHVTCALVYQAKAIESLKLRLSAGGQEFENSRLVLVASILLIMFELMYGAKTESMARIATSAVSVLKDKISLTSGTQPKRQKSWESASASEDERTLSRPLDDTGMEEAEYALPRIAALFRGRRQCGEAVDEGELFSWMDLPSSQLGMESIGPPQWEAPVVDRMHDWFRFEVVTFIWSKNVSNIQPSTATEDTWKRLHDEQAALLQICNSWVDYFMQRLETTTVDATRSDADVCHQFIWRSRLCSTHDRRVSIMAALSENPGDIWTAQADHVLASLEVGEPLVQISTRKEAFKAHMESRVDLLSPAFVQVLLHCRDRRVQRKILQLMMPLLSCIQFAGKGEAQNTIYTARWWHQLFMSLKKSGIRDVVVDILEEDAATGYTLGIQADEREFLLAYLE